MTHFRARVKCFQPLLFALAATVGLLACTDVPPASGGTAGTGGMAGTGGTGADAGVGGMGGDAGTGGTGGTANTPPEATIVQPDMDSETSNPDYVYDGYDMDLELWYKDITLEGTGIDLEDGTLTGEALQWKTNQTAVQAEVIGTGENPTVRLYSNNCFGITHIITLEVTDSDGVTTISAPRTLFIWTLC
ncbi:MAG: hypothetical protein KJO40_05370 [Deltaproteobacteria bacterium]|nr:hypothetical protein [Deltaproteobacteria bacterium]NND28088.1 hypothetical protein [Myxococcales bacterium]MBT8463278.1 hypothetical protein [Deltaproteobacteria bacterium]MBT8482175.1 hypothetical protein [Deltaproteobacteria bacterium]NNK09487.1 hypothetical protein [Myxococcales bacterium]